MGSNMDTQLVLSICQIIAVAVIPLMIWIIGNRQQQKKEKNESKRELFLELMKQRKTMCLTRERVDALNLIDVVFQDDEKVRVAWKAYLASLNPLSPEYTNSNAYQLDLLSEMAAVLGYKKLKQTEIDKFYEPQFLIDEQEIERKLKIEIAQYFKSVNEIKKD